MNKLPQITVAFWIMKICATTLGETLGDYFSMTLKFGYSTALTITFIFFLIALIIQLFAKNIYPYSFGW
jgi:uncharacterized membrane-anchored protein